MLSVKITWNFIFLSFVYAVTNSRVENSILGYTPAYGTVLTNFFSKILVRQISASQLFSILTERSGNLADIPVSVRTIGFVPI